MIHSTFNTPFAFNYVKAINWSNSTQEYILKVEYD